MIHILDNANEAVVAAEETLNQAGQATSEYATELKNETIAAAHDVQEQAANTTHNIQGLLFIDLFFFFFIYIKYF